MEQIDKEGKTLRRRKISAVNWTRKLTAKLIDLYRSHPHLWDVSSENYKNRHLRNLSIDEMSKTLDVPAQDVNDKIHNLRCQFHNICRKRLKCQNADDFKVTWEFYDALKFINGHSNNGDTMTLYKIEGNVNEDIEYEVEDSSNNSSNVEISYSPLAAGSPPPQVESPPPPPTSPVLEHQGITIATKRNYLKRKKNFSRNPMEPSASPNQCIGLQVTKPADDSFKIFGDFVADELRSMNSRAPDLQMQAKLEIQRIVLKMNELYDTRTQCRFNV